MTNLTGLGARVDAVIDRAMRARRIVGAVVLIARDGEQIYECASGSMDREAGIPMRGDVIFRLASLTKPIVSAAALAQIDQGAIGLDDRVTRWLPDFRPRLADGREPGITIRHLVTHTAGLSYGSAEPPNGPYHQAKVSDGMDRSGLSIEENLQRIASVPLSFEPGTAWQYSVATDVLGAVVARAFGGTLSEAVAHYVTKPLGMVDTGFVVVDQMRLSVAYADASPEPERMRDPHFIATNGEIGLWFSPSRILDPLSYQSGGGGMAGTATDFLTFLETLRTGGTPILKPATVAMALENQIGESSTWDPGGKFGFLSAVLADPAAAKSPQTAGSWHWGGSYGHSWFVDPALGLTVVACTNTAVEGCLGKLPNEIRDAVYGRA